jgi:hypothetical protein
MSALINKGTGYAIDASTAANNINAGSRIASWQFTNATANVAIVNVYTSNVSVTATTGVAIPTNSSAVVCGDFGNGWTGNVWVSAILAAGSGTVYAIPVIERT